MSLPAAWVDHIFAKLTVAYGQRFMGLYAGLEIAAVKADWAVTLAAFQQNHAALSYGLDHLPVDHPPNALQFREICRRRPDKPAKALPEPDGSPKAKAEGVAALRHLASALKQPNDAGWAYRLRRREEAGEDLTPFQREAWREAFGVTRRHDEAFHA